MTTEAIEQKREFNVNVRKISADQQPKNPYLLILVPVAQDGPGKMLEYGTEEELRGALLMVGGSDQAVEKIMAKVNEAGESVKGTVALSEDVAVLFGCAGGWSKGSGAEAEEY